MYKIGILSDTHNLLRESVTDLLRTCDVILHAGDISSPQLLNQLKSIAPLYAVRGNTDKELAAELPHSLSINLYGINIYMIHNKKLITDDIHDKNLIIYGHSHKYEQLQNNGQTWLNPGSCGRRRFSLPVTMCHDFTNDTKYILAPSCYTVCTRFFLSIHALHDFIAGLHFSQSCNFWFLFFYCILFSLYTFH